MYVSGIVVGVVGSVNVVGQKNLCFVLCDCPWLCDGPVPKLEYTGA